MGRGVGTVRVTIDAWARPGVVLGQRGLRTGLLGRRAERLPPICVDNVVEQDPSKYIPPPKFSKKLKKVLH